MVDHPSTSNVTLAEMKKGQSGKVVSITDCACLGDRLEALGIRPGKEVYKLSRAFRKGPVTVKIGASRIAVGFGMAMKIIVKISENQ